MSNVYQEKISSHPINYLTFWIFYYCINPKTISRYYNLLLRTVSLRLNLYKTNIRFSFQEKNYLYILLNAVCPVHTTLLLYKKTQRNINVIIGQHDSYD